MRKLPSFTEFAFIRNQHVYMHSFKMEMFHYMLGWKLLTRMVSDMDAMFSCKFNLCDVRMHIAIACIVPRGPPQGSPLKRRRFLWLLLSGGSRLLGRVKALKYFCVNYGDESFFQLEIILNILVSMLRFIWMPMLRVYGQFNDFYSCSTRIDFRCRIWRLQTSDSDV